MHIFIASQSQCTTRTLLTATSSHTGAVGFVDNDTVGCSSRYEGGAVGEYGCLRVGVEGYVGDSVAESADEEGYVADEPSELDLM